MAAKSCVHLSAIPACHDLLVNGAYPAQIAAAKRMICFARPMSSQMQKEYR
jgi:hypothetical protein